MCSVSIGVRGHRKLRSGIGWTDSKSIHECTADVFALDSAPIVVGPRMSSIVYADVRRERSADRSGPCRRYVEPITAGAEEISPPIEEHGSGGMQAAGGRHTDPRPGI